jgi:hypothetical protein
VKGYNGNGGHIIYGGLMWKGAGQMSEDEEGPKETGNAHMVKWRTDGRGGNGTEGDTTGRGPHINTTPFRTPPPPSVKSRNAGGLRNETSAIDLGGQILVVQNYLLIKMTRPSTKLWKNGFSESLSSPKGTLLSGEYPYMIMC